MCCEGVTVLCSATLQLSHSLCVPCEILCLPAMIPDFMTEPLECDALITNQQRLVNELGDT